MPIQIIDSWEVSIRPCEVNRFADFFGSHTQISGGNNEFRDLMKFLTDTRMSLVDLVISSDSYYSWAKAKCTKEAKVTHIFDLLNITRAKEDLKIYWTPETKKKILEGLSLRNYKKDAALLAAMQNL